MPIPADELDELLALMNVRHSLADLLGAAVAEQLTPLPPVPDDAVTRRAVMN